MKTMSRALIALFFVLQAAHTEISFADKVKVACNWRQHHLW